MLLRNIEKTEQIFDAVERQIRQFKLNSGLNCIEQCGLCCLKESIEASVLEFTPAALYLYKSGAGEAILQKLQDEPERKICVFFNPFQGEGSCSMYAKRGLICRLFGFSVSRNKFDQPVLVTCKHIKESVIYRDHYPFIHQSPSISHFYMKLRGIDLKNTQKMLPVNEAIREAIEMVYFYFEFRGGRKAG